MEARILTDEQEIIEAKKLTYEVLVKEQKWEIKPDNPSGLHIKDLPQGKVLWDDYDAVATRLGVFEENTLVGCLRICKRLNGKFELEHYNSLLDFIQKDELAVEITRLAVGKKYRFSIVILLLFRLTYESLLEKGGYAWGTGFWPTPGKLYVNKFGFTRHEIPFRYYFDDPKEVYLYYINGYDRPYISKMISEFNILLARKEKILEGRS
ncbi:GNAT family N-acyltransferase [Okeania sp. SIO2B3]|uniref:GNAT family N-acyltransferase n=1 Tax=Okeania sp. SIO2B3 TaxID=2607784 RepID=UPI0013C13F19|nr:GNAT family N-acyltransferase [Okeania sp. SIO2B3]NET41710.1 GNAT family N-acetyltransferase [Okeania sp. SIO2B3]